MHRGGQAPRPANDIKHGKMAVVGLAGGFWPISNTPIVPSIFSITREHPSPRFIYIPKLILCQVKVQSWVNGKEDDEFVGVGARFGPKIVSKEKHANRTKLTLADPIECCSPPKQKVCLILQLPTLNICLSVFKRSIASSSS
jgi:hypothetical protein